MPSSLVKKVAEERNMSVDKVEEYWDKAKKVADKKFKESDDSYYPYTTRVFKNMVGMAALNQSVN
ncbi:hypothetical protein GR11A_00246 [Vibrio phage vB_VcorM_GR11A]|nr:hypothetical protein GR11A_00246 [Vibrio phage vB_VcorM_GR11A]